MAAVMLGSPKGLMVAVIGEAVGGFWAVGKSGLVGACLAGMIWAGASVAAVTWDAARGSLAAEMGGPARASLAAGSWGPAGAS